MHTCCSHGQLYICWLHLELIREAFPKGLLVKAFHSTSQLEKDTNDA